MTQIANPKPQTATRPKPQSVRRTRRIVNVQLLVISAVVLGMLSVGAFAWYQRQSALVSRTLLQRASVLEQEGKAEEAAAYLARYLQLEPADDEARVRLIAAFEQTAGSAHGKNRLVSLLYQTIGAFPDRRDLRLKLSQNLYELGLFADAQKQAELVISPPGLADDEAPNATQDESTAAIIDAAERVKALAMTAQARPGEDALFDEVVAALSESLKDNAGDVLVASSKAYLFRSFPKEVGQENAAREADTTMDQMVAADPQNVEALIARYRYRSKYHPESAKVDLDAALATAPDNVTALLLAVDAALMSGDKQSFELALAHAEKVIQLLPQDARGYVALGKLYSAQGDTKQAISTLRQGGGKLKTSDLDLDYLLASLVLESESIDVANDAVASFKKTARQILPYVDRLARNKIENMTRLLDGKLSIAKQDVAGAITSLEAIIASVDRSAGFRDSQEALLAYDLLANLSARHGRPDNAAAYWTALAERSPAFGQASWKAGLANLELGRVDDAVSQIEAYLKLPKAAPEARLSLLQAQLQQQLARPADARSWSAFGKSLDTCRKAFSDRTDWKLAEVLYLISLGTKDAKTNALERMVQLEAQGVKDESLYPRLIALRLQLGDIPGAERLLERYGEIQPNESRRALLRASLLAGSNRIPEALQLLNDAAASQASVDEKLALGELRLKLLLATQKWDLAQELVGQLIGQHPNHPKLLANGIEISLRRQDFTTAAKLVDELQSAKNIEHFDRRYYKARLLVATYDTLGADERNELETSIESLRSDRPTWPPFLTLAGQLAEAQGRRADAIGIYESAIQMGDRHSETVERLVRLLYAEGRFAEASERLSQLRTEGATLGRFESLAIAAAVKGNRLAEARSLAEDAVKRGSKDPAHYILLASLLHADGDKVSAESTLRTAVGEFPQDGRVWNAVFLYFLQIGEHERAQQALDRWASQVPHSESEKLLILGQGHEALGNIAAAQDFYLQAAESSEENVTAHFLLAKSLISSDMPKAMHELDLVLKKSPKHAEARRLQATLLATTGSEQDWTRALSLLESDADGTAKDAQSDDRLRAILLSRQGKVREDRINNLQASRDILSKRLESNSDPAADIDRTLLAAMCEQEANLSGDLRLIQVARDVIQPVVDRPNVTTEQLLSYIQFLLRNLALANASPEANTDQETIREVLARDASIRIDALEKIVSKDPESSDSRMLPVALRMKLLQAQSKPAEGLGLLNRFVDARLSASESETERGRLFLQAGKLCASIGEFAAAEDWFRKLEKIAPQSYILVAQSLVEQQKPDDAVRLCLQMIRNKPTPEGAVAVAQILSSNKVSPDLEKQALRVIDEALDADRGNLNLLMSSAVLRTTRNENEEAIRLFRRVVEIQPRNVLALNNLATLLAEQPDRLEEAKRFVEKAVEASGRQPALLDTLGTILLRSKQFKPAIAALEEAVAGGANDPRYYFHLAAAYDGDGQMALAQEKLKKAIGLGLEDTILTSGDRELLVSLKKQALSQN